MHPKINLAILDDHELFSQGLKSLLEKESFSKSIQCCRTSDELFGLLKEKSIELLLLDLNLIEEDGLGLIEPIKKVAPGIKIIILTSYDNDQFSRIAVKSGVDAYVLKDFTKEDLVNTINIVMTGNKLSQSEVSTKKPKPLRINIHYLDEFLKRHRLTRREVDIISLIAQGYTNKNIADLFHISDNTVKTHRKNIKRKLKFANTADIVKFAYDTGILN